MPDEERFQAIYDRVVRRFWADATPIEEAEFRRMVEAEGLRYPANRTPIVPSPAAAMRMGL